MSVSKKKEAQQAVTLMELMVVIVIIGILAGIAIPMFPRAMEATKAKGAVAALQQIRTGERVYRVEENTYWPRAAAVSTISTINDTLRVFLDTRDEGNWGYSVDATDATHFTATATRTSGMYKNKQIRIDQDGDVTAGPNPWPLALPGQ